MIVLSLGLHSDRKKFIQAVKIQNPIKIGIPGKMISSMYINFHRNWYRAQICRVCQIIIYHKIELIFFFFLYSNARHTRLFLQRNYGTTFKKWNWHYGCYQLCCAIAYCKILIETTRKISVKGHCWTLVAWKWSFRDPRRLIFSKHRSHFNIKNYTVKTAEV